MNISVPVVLHQSGAVTPTSHSLTSITTNSQWFTSEIQQMMHGFGDASKPLIESAGLIEEIVKTQLRDLLHRATEIALTRNSRHVGLEEFIFLLRKDKSKLRRFLRYVKLKEMKSMNFKVSVSDDEEASDYLSGDFKQYSQKKLNTCIEFIKTIDQTGELLTLLDDTQPDEIKFERAVRAELLTRNMDRQQYFSFCQSRRCSFTPRYKMIPFKEWLLGNISLEPKLNAPAMETLAYITHEMISQIVDLSLLVKFDMSAQIQHPLESLIQTATYDKDLMIPNLMSGNKSPQKLPSPDISPPASPTVSTPSASSTTNFIQKRAKKRRKFEDQTSKELVTSQAIQLHHIQEAIRRYSQFIGPFSDLYKLPSVPARHQLLCL